MSRNGAIGCIFFLLASVADAQVTFIIESIPSATPETDTIFITGTFNNWVPNDPRYALQQQLSGQFAVVVPATPGKMEYKFTRGSWVKVETNKENKYTANRILDDGTTKKVYVRIDNWLDLGGARPLNYVVFYFFACAFQAIALTLAAFRITKKDHLKFKPLFVVNATITGLLVLLILRETTNPVWHSYVSFLFHISFFCWGPLMLFFIERFYSGAGNAGFYRWFLPALLALLFVMVRMMNISDLRFLSETILPPFTTINLLVIAIGFLFNIFLHVRIFRQFVFLQSGMPTGATARIRFLYFFYWASVVSLAMIPLNVLLIRSAVSSHFIEGFHPTAIALSALLFIETYFLWRYPDILKEEKSVSAPAEGSHEWMERVNLLMKNEKPYKKPELSVSDLAEMLGTKPHVLSRMINDSYHKNFRDFVNTYRIEEFIRLANTKEYRHFTFLALAQEVGFNSKSTFNLAFKKFTNVSPREYFKSKEFT